MTKTTTETETTTAPAAGAAVVVVTHPPRTFRQELITRLTSRKLWMVLIACSIPWAGLERGVDHLYALQQWQAAVYGSMFLAVMGGIVAIVCKYMGIDSTVSTATSVTGAISAAASHAFEKREDKSESHAVIEHVERVVDEGAAGSPERRPWTSTEEPE